VCEYVGEYITDMEAETREDTYLFDLENKVTFTDLELFRSQVCLFKEKERGIYNGRFTVD